MSRASHRRRGAIRRTVAAYRSPRAAAHVAARALTCPTGPILDALEGRAHLLDFGCGHGLITLAALGAHGGLTAVGLDPDAHKLGLARSAAATLDMGDRVRFVDRLGDAEADGPFDAFAICDVLYLLGPQRAVELMHELVELSADDAVIVVKEMGTGRSWKGRINQVQEHIATEVLRYTQGDRIELVDLGVVGQVLREHGFRVEIRPIDARYPHPHLLLVARRP